jgi:voltage-gated potassium channel
VLALLLLAAVVIGGTVGYVMIEGWNVWDAFYMTIITVTTVGYGEVHPLSFRGEIFTTILVMLGVGGAFYTFSLLAALVVEGGLRARVEKRRYKRMLENVENHFIVCGYGRIGEVIVQELKRHDVPFVVVERDPDRVQAVIENGGLAVEADASREEVLERVGVRRAKGLIAAVGTDAENVYAVLTARVLKPDLYIVGRAETADAVRKLKRAGADRVISPYQIGALQMAQTAIRPAVVDFVELLTKHQHLEMNQVSIADHSALNGQSIAEANLRQRFGVIVVGVQHGRGTIEFNPSPDFRMHTDDLLVVLGPVDSVRRLNALASEPA